MSTYEKMDLERKVEWVTALRSDEYSQGKDRLQKNGRFCCLGVLCDLAAKRGEGTWNHDGSVSFHPVTEPFNSAVTVLPETVRNTVNIARGATRTLMDMNDCGGKNFTEIADWIEEYL